MIYYCCNIHYFKWIFSCNLNAQTDTMHTQSCTKAVLDFWCNLFPQKEIKGHNIYDFITGSSRRKETEKLGAKLSFKYTSSNTNPTIVFIKRGMPPNRATSVWTLCCSYPMERSFLPALRLQRGVFGITPLLLLSLWWYWSSSVWMQVLWAEFSRSFPQCGVRGCVCWFLLSDPTRLCQSLSGLRRLKFIKKIRMVQRR